MYICPTYELPKDVRNKHQVPQDVVLDTLGTESNSGSFERERKDEKKKKKKKKSKHKRRSKHEDDDDDQLSDTGYESPPSITTNNPHDEDDRHRPTTQKYPMGRRLSATGRLFASFRRSNVEMEISDNDDDSVQD
jgi:hypothetical protein